ncbi:MAG: branched-chain amino acid ABC transporter permease [Meiothermus sp.]|uniref:branched-chain amino acid ABC transporter permease n=1 Tax=Meiothermus sp. TaxID=1955249 RepID=UPI0025D1A503|nr:branched-chain amino acid ABC transporter permease [Meiothermus sp.]MCS7057442.1 branched-chain amino acid ABC transporter permease [Meiothermus sp.]MCS7193550.1 branched-chain amino acid ABC transporter permease [Meiothermus sp.]MCX7739991.1 branched-chain amino acid ABC transporter permease [Meiothermus sp.]MDW8091603.1 branched-chain amino acid ABC transporter permease [Meiothermus sp.]MDW8481527.1 branched-chain amino acid ABC transporter permease [Meiothermus sp.]
MDLALNLQTALNGLANGALYAVIAAGFVLVYRATSVVNFAIAEFLLIGAYLTYTFSLFLPLLPAILLALPLAFAFGVLVERVFVRPLLGRNVVAVIMATIGLASALDGATLLIWGPDQKAMGTADAFQLPKEVPNLALRLGEVFLSSKAVWSLILALPLALLLIAMLKYSRYGILLRAISESETAALALGINAPRVVAVAWGISALMATVGGAFLAGAAGGGGPGHHLILLGLVVFPVAILGGFDSVPGAVVAGLLIGLIEAFSQLYLESLLPGITQAIPFLIVLLVLLFRPYGLFGQHRIERV